MSMQEKLAHVRGDVDSIMRKYEKLTASERHAFKISRKKEPRLHQSDYRSPRRVDWVITLRSSKKSDNLYMSAWWQVQGIGVEAFCLSPTSAFYFDTHFFQRYRIRESDVPGAADNIKRFLRINYDVVTKTLDTERYGMKEVAGIASEGLFLGTLRPGGIVACDTFLSNEMLREDQQALQRELQFHAHTKEWSKVRMDQYGKELQKVLVALDRLEAKWEQE
jgi:hypothetical protein